MEKMNKSVYQGNDIPKGILSTILMCAHESTLLHDLYGYNPWGEYDDVDCYNFKLVYIRYNIYRVMIFDHTLETWHDMFTGKLYYVRHDEID
jgi:hypothetical protein